MSARKSPQKQPGFTRGRRIADLMTPEYTSFLASSLAAERTGDAETALEYHRGIPMFSKGQHNRVLTQLASLADEMTPWLWARWAAYQCTRAEDPGTESFFITRGALDYTIRMFYGDRMQAAYDEGRDAMDVIKMVMGESWVCHQLCTFELGGLQEFLDNLAEGRLAEHAELTRHWVTAHMRGLRVERSEAECLVVTDLRTKQELRLLDLGAGLRCGPGGHLLGRLVPSGTLPSFMFDSTPLVVDHLTAKAVAVAIGGGWVTALCRALTEGRLRLEDLESKDHELASDVPGPALLERGTRPGELARVTQQLREGRNEVGRAAFRILRNAAAGTFGGDGQAPYVGAAALDPHGYEEARRRLDAPEHREHWLHWAGLVPDPARRRLSLLAEKSAAAAA